MADKHKKPNPKLHPKLRMFANGSTEVNAIRAEMCSNLVVSRQVREQIPRVRGDADAPVSKSSIRTDLGKGELEAPPDAKACAFVQLTSSASDATFDGQSGRRGRLAVVTVPVAELYALAERPEVAHIELGEPLSAPAPVVSPGPVKAPKAGGRRFGGIAANGGKDVLIGIIDVGGFDFAHPDFLDDKGNTRFLAIWDQGGRNSRPPPSAKEGESTIGRFDYGAEFTQEILNNAIKHSKELGLAPQELERQSQMSPGSHGTHVASIAAGNRGLCPKSLIAAVLVCIPSEEMDRRSSFYDSSRIVHAVDYLLRLADDLNMPISINISLGTNGHAHDATSPASRWIDSALTERGRSVCVAAGNAGQEIAQFEGDLGYVLGRVHTSGEIPARGLHSEIHWVVVGNGKTDISENELELWYSPQDQFAVSVKPPGGGWVGPIEAGEFVENRRLPDGSFVSIYNELYHPANGANYISVYLSPYMCKYGVIGVPADTWTIRLEGIEVRNGKYHAWIERDDPRDEGRVGNRELWRYPSFFAEGSFVDNSTVSSLACGNQIISVANLDEVGNRISKTSSQGPTRDGRFKPEVAAPGTNIVAAKGFDDGDDTWIKMSGTSMASPYVTGVIGLMLAVEPTLSAAQIAGIIQRTARPLPGATYTWLNDAGFGVINPEACLKEAARIGQRTDLTRRA